MRPRHSGAPPSPRGRRRPGVRGSPGRERPAGRLGSRLHRPHRPAGRRHTVLGRHTAGRPLSRDAGQPAAPPHRPGHARDCPPGGSRGRIARLPGPAPNGAEYGGQSDRLIRLQHDLRLARGRGRRSAQHRGAARRIPSVTLSAATLGSTSGFTIAVPDTWKVSIRGTAAFAEAPTGGAFLQIDLTPHTYRDMLREARYLAALTLEQGKFPGYLGLGIRPANVRGARGAAWQFTWQSPALGRVRAAGPRIRRVHAGRPAVLRALHVVAQHGVEQQSGRLRRGSAHLPAVSVAGRRYQPPARAD